MWGLVIEKAPYMVITDLNPSPSRESTVVLRGSERKREEGLESRRFEEINLTKVRILINILNGVLNVRLYVYCICLANKNY